MVDAVTGFLAGRETVVDMTLGAGGHAAALLASGVGVSRSCFIALIPAALYPIYRLLTARPSARVAPVAP